MEWHYSRGGKQEGPVTEARIKSLIAAGELEASDLVWKAGLDKWISALEAFPDFTSLSIDGRTKPISAPGHLSSSTGRPFLMQEKMNGNYFSRHWRGELSLGVSYWVNGFLANFILMAAIFSLAEMTKKNSSDYNLVIYWVGVYAVGFAIVIWQLTGIWRSANNHIETTNRRFWARAAQVTVALGLLRFFGDFVGTGVPAIQESIKQGNWLTEHAKWEVNLLRDGTEIEVRGGIGRGISADLEKFLNAAPNVRLVHLNLEVGGLVEEGEKLNAIFRNRKLATYTSSICISACTIAFMGGVERYLKKDAKLGFHAYKVAGVSTDATDYSGSKRSLIASGVSPEFAEKIFRTSNDTVWYPESSDLLRNGVVTAVVSGDEFGLSGFKRQAIATSLETELLATKLYRVIKQREPEMFNVIVANFRDGLQAGRSMDELRPTIGPHVQKLREKYLPYASDESVKAFADHFTQVAKLLRSSPRTCLGYLRDGDPQAVNAAIKMYPSGFGKSELHILAEMVESADLLRTTPSKGEKDRLLGIVIDRAMEQLGDRKSIISELANPQADPAKWCDSFYAVYLAVGSLPASQARVAAIALAE